MRALLCAFVLAIAGGCGGTHLRVVGYPEADIYVTSTPGKDYTFIGRTAGTKEYVLDYVLPKTFENAKLGLLIKSPQGSWTDQVYTDRDVTVYYPPEGVPLRKATPPPAPAAASARPPAKPAGTAPAESPAEPPTATVSPN